MWVLHQISFPGVGILALIFTMAEKDATFTSHQVDQFYSFTWSDIMSFLASANICFIPTSHYACLNHTKRHCTGFC